MTWLKLKADRRPAARVASRVSVKRGKNKPTLLQAIPFRFASDSDVQAGSQITEALHQGSEETTQKAGREECFSKRLHRLTRDMHGQRYRDSWVDKECRDALAEC